jgi:hypothetical protein
MLRRRAPIPAADLPKPRAAANDNSALIIDLPLPPSVNSLVARLGNSSSVVKTWIRVCDRMLLPETRRLREGRITGLFECHIWWAHDAPGDIDNRVKPLLDYLQRIEVIADDRDCQRLVVDYGDVPDCRVLLIPWRPRT